MARSPEICATLSSSLLLLFFLACSGDSPQSPMAPPPSHGPSVPVSTVEVSPQADTVFAAGEAIQFEAIARDAQGNALTGRTFSWTSSDKDVATVDQSGLATAHDFGSAAIQAETEGVNGSSSFVVRERLAALILTAQPEGAQAGEPFETQPTVELRDSSGNVIQGDSATAVTASLASGGGELSGTLTQTAVGGVVTFTDLGVGGTTGERTLSFSGDGFEAAKSANFVVAPGPAAQLAIYSGAEQSAPADTDLPEPLTVRVTDVFDNGVPDIEVQWTVTAGNGSPSSSTALSDASGVADVGYKLGRFAGVETIEATSTSVAAAPAQFSVTATPNATITGVVNPVSQLLSTGFTETTLASPNRRMSRLLESLGSGAGADRNLSSGEPRYVPGELLVTFRSTALSAPRAGSMAYRSAGTAWTVSEAMRTRLQAHEAAGRLQNRGISPAVLTARVKVPEAQDLESVAAELRRDPAVAVVERHPIAQHFGIRSTATQGPGTNLPNDPLWPWQAWHYAMIDLPRAWNIATGTPTVVVAVLDDGIRFDHPAIASNLTADGYDFVSNDELIPICSGGWIGRSGDGDGYDPDPTIPWDVIIDPMLGCIAEAKESGGHGLHVAGTIGATGNDGIGGTGVNWQVAIRPVRVLGLDGGTDYDIAQGVLYAAGLPADDGAGGFVQAPTAAPIINMSLGGPTSSHALEDAILAASGAGSLIIAAAGNAASSTPNYPAGYSQTLSVSAVSPTGALASYSSFGSTIDIAAPGGEKALGCDFAVISTTWNFVQETARHDCWQGTSMAAPHVAGVAALLLAQNPGLSREVLRARLLDYAVDIGPAGKDVFFGHGLVNARNSLTQSFAPARSTFVRLMNGDTGEIVGTAAAQPDGSYVFTALPDGNYHVFAGEDEETDGIFGVPVRRWGARGGTVTPSAVEVEGAGEYPSSFPIGHPVEVEPNDAFGQANRLVLGGYVLGTIENGDSDVYAVQIPETGAYSFETAAVEGACGFALEEDTILTLYSEAGSLIAQNDARDLAALDLCAEINETLDSGLYFLQVTGWNGEGRRYGVMAGEGS